MKVISVFNLSGGVGKSTLTKELGYSLAQLGHRVLLIDIDPQGSLTSFLGMDDTLPDNATTIYDAIMGDRNPIIPAIDQEGWAWGLHLAPANLHLARAQMELVVADMRDHRLQRFIAQHAASDFDYILIDCPPSMDILPYLALVASTHVLVPIQTEYKCVKGTDLVLGMINRVTKVNPKLRIACFTPTLYDQRINHHRETLKFIQQLSQVAPVMPPVTKCALLARSAHDHRPLAALIGLGASPNELATRNAIYSTVAHLTTL